MQNSRQAQHYVSKKQKYHYYEMLLANCDTQFLEDMRRSGFLKLSPAKNFYYPEYALTIQELNDCITRCNNNITKNRNNV